MADKDWRRYYAPILAHKTSGECRLWAGRLFLDYAKAHLKAAEINRAKSGNYRCIGVAGLRGKRADVQREIWERAV